MSEGVDLIHLSPDEWQAVKAAAAELDLVHGGYFRTRPNGVLFFCGPENAPPGWSQGFPEGSPDLPRAAVGAAEVVEVGPDDELTIRLRVSNWGAMRDVKHAYDQGAYRGRHEEFIRAQEAALRGRPEERAWLHGQFQRLKSHASGTVLD